MHRNLAYGNSEKIGKVIELAISYKSHRKSIQKIKPAINMPSLSSIKKTDQLTINRIKYAKESRNLKSISITKDNQAYSQRLSRAQSVFKKAKQNPQMTLNPSRINYHTKESCLQKSKSKSRLSQRNSLNSSDSQRSICSNFMSRTRRYKEIEQQNKKMAKRIQQPKTNMNTKFKVYDKQFEKQQEYVKIRSRFSQRSKSIMQSLMLDGLKMEKKNLQFLPQINSPRSKLETSRTINTSRTALGEKNDKQKHDTRLRTLQFAKNMQSQLKKVRQSRNY